jgi:hypothetical protein
LKLISEGRSRSSTWGVIVTPAPTIPSMTTEVGPISAGVISSRLSSVKTASSFSDGRSRR